MNTRDEKEYFQDHLTAINAQYGLDEATSYLIGFFSRNVPHQAILTACGFFTAIFHPDFNDTRDLSFFVGGFAIMGFYLWHMIDSFRIFFSGYTYLATENVRWILGEALKVIPSDNEEIVSDLKDGLTSESSEDVFKAFNSLKAWANDHDIDLNEMLPEEDDEEYYDDDL